MKPKVICIIPARGGSKGLKNKNIRKINNKPLIYYPIKAALKSKVCDKIVVTTDSNNIAKLSKKYGAEVPFLREKKYAKDLTTTEKTLQHALLNFEKFYKTKYDICVFLTCTNLFRKISWIKEAVNILKTNNKIDSAFSVHEMYKHFWGKKGKLFTKVLPWMRTYTSRQVGNKIYREDTPLTLASRAHFWRKGKRIGKHNHFIINNDPFTSIDIHSKKDLELAEIIMKFLKAKKLDKDMVVN